MSEPNRQIPDGEAGARVDDSQTAPSRVRKARPRVEILREVKEDAKGKGHGTWTVIRWAGALGRRKQVRTNLSLFGALWQAWAAMKAMNHE